jgi:hypothetical protein
MTRESRNLQGQHTMQIQGSVPLFSRSAILLILLALPVVARHPEAATVPGIGDSIVINELKVTLLDARPLSFDEYRRASDTSAQEWDGGGFRFAFLVENRPGAPIGPALGEVRVFVGSRLYNAVTNPTSRKAFAPDVVIRSTADFFSRTYGRSLTQHGPAPRDSSYLHALDVFVRGAVVPKGSSVVVELEQGETHRPDASGRLRALTPAEMGATWTAFRFSAAPARDAR